MHLRSFAVLLLGSMALGQSAPGSPSAPSAPKSAVGQRPSDPGSAAATSAVAPTDPVITILGLCDTPAASKTVKPASAKAPADCKTVVTRAQFESLANALQPEMAPVMKKKLAELYPTMIIMSHTARQRGYENTAQFKKLMEFSRLQVLSAQLNRAVQKEAENVPAADIDKYYKENSGTYQQLSLQRIFVPKGKAPQPGSDKTSPAGAATPAKSDEDAAKKEAESLQKRAAAGEDFDKLQKEAFEFAGLNTPTSSTNVKLAASDLPPAEHVVLDLKPGEISQALAETNGYFIYKFLGKEQKPLDDKSREEIKSKLAHQRFQSIMDDLHKSLLTTLSEAYFGTEAAQAGAGRSVPGSRPMPPFTPAASTGSPAAPVSSAARVSGPAAVKTEAPETTTAKPTTPQGAEPPR
jgi:PPIC-type PPIASE domain